MTDPEHVPVTHDRIHAQALELLQSESVITADDVAAAMAERSRGDGTERVADVLVRRGVVRAGEITRATAACLGVPFAELSVAMVREEAVACLPPRLLAEQNLLPLTCAEGWLTVAMERFTDLDLIEDLRLQSGHRIQVIAAEPENLRGVREEVLRSLGRSWQDVADESSLEIDRILGDLHADELTIVERGGSADEPDLAAADGSPVIKLVNCIIQNGVETGASDIHVEPDDACFRVRNRVDGELFETIRPPARLLSAVVNRIKIIGGMDIAERRLPQDGAITVTFSGRPIDLRVSTMTTRYGEKVVMRIVDRSAAVLGPEQLGLRPDMLGRLRDLVRQPTGIVLVTGPTGSGKTSTLYALLSEITSVRRNISTIEDPVERRLHGVNQFQINRQAGFTFARALRSLLRQDPDVIMVGEIRDAETAGLATEAALTGHLVLSTLHTNDALTAVTRLVNIGVEPYLVAATLRGVLAQRLVLRVCVHCRVPTPVSPVKRAALDRLAGQPCGLDTEQVGAGCPRCRNTGGSGRIGVFEQLLLNEELLSAIARDSGTSGLRRLARPRNMVTLFEDGIEKVRDGSISVDGLLEVVSHTPETIDDVPFRVAA